MSLLGSAKGCCSSGIADDAAAWAHRASSRIVDRIFAQTARTPNGVVDRLKEMARADEEIGNLGQGQGQGQSYHRFTSRHCAAASLRPGTANQRAQEC